MRPQPRRRRQRSVLDLLGFEHPPSRAGEAAMSTLVLWALGVLVILVTRWSGAREPRISRREQAGHFWLWEHEGTREVSHE